MSSAIFKNRRVVVGRVKDVFKRVLGVPYLVLYEQSLCRGLLCVEFSASII